MDITQFKYEDFSTREKILVDKYNDGTLTHEFLLNWLNEKKYGVGTYCRWMEYLGLKEEVEPEYARQYFQDRVCCV